MAVGKSTVEISLFILLPIMAMSLSVMRLLEAAGVMDWIVKLLLPVLRPLGLTGLSVFAMLQVNLVSFAAPIATLATMDKRGASDRHLAATLAMLLAMGQANVSFPLAPLGLKIGIFLLISVIGGILASVSTFYVFGRYLSVNEQKMDESLAHPVLAEPKGILAIINHAGGEAFKIAVGTIPMLALSLLVVSVIKGIGGFAMIEMLVSPVLHFAQIDAKIVVPTLTKYLGGGTAVLGLLVELQRNHQVDAYFLNESAGWLVNSLDLPGVAILMTAAPRLANIWKPAAFGAFFGIIFRTGMQVYLH